MATLVLVHGTTGGGWVWQPIASRLRSAGHEVFTPTLTGLGERSHLLTREIGLDTHITDIVHVLHYEDLAGVFLVGHSHAGMVITGVADRMPERIERLIYLDALVPENGECGVDLVAAEVRREMEQRVQAEGDGWLFPVMRGPNDVSTLNTPHPWKSWVDAIALVNPASHRIPCTYVRFTADKQAGQFFQLALETSWQRARHLAWPLHEVDTVHQIVPDPAPKTSVLLELVSSTLSKC